MQAVELRRQVSAVLDSEPPANAPVFSRALSLPPAPGSPGLEPFGLDLPAPFGGRLRRQVSVQPFRDEPELASPASPCLRKPGPELQEPGAARKKKIAQAPRARRASFGDQDDFFGVQKDFLGAQGAQQPELLRVQREARIVAKHAERPPELPLVVWLGRAEAPEQHRALGLIGGKAVPLDALARAGVAPVPAAACVTTQAYAEFVRMHGLGPRIRELLSQDPADAQVGARLRELRRTILSAELPERLALELVREFVSALPAEAQARGSCAVRSSGTSEDTASHSFAGQYATVLNVPLGSVGQILRAIRRCWASMFSARTLSYRRSLLRSQSSPPLMAVIVQQQLDPASAGVLFTLDPRSSEDAVFVVEGAWGLGEAVVSGVVSPHRFELAWDAVPEISGVRTLERLVLGASTPSQQRKLCFRASAEEKEQEGDGDDNEEEEEEEEEENPFIEWVDTSEEERRSPVLDAEQLAELARLGLKVAQHYGRPYDLEWAFEKGQLYLLQARPITATTVDSEHPYLNAELGADSQFSTSMCAVAYANMMSRVLEAEAEAQRAQGVPEKRLPQIPPEEIRVKFFFGTAPFIHAKLWRLYSWNSWSALADNKSLVQITDAVLPEIQRLEVEFTRALPLLFRLEKTLGATTDLELVQRAEQMISWQTRIDTQSYLAGAAVEFFETQVQRWIDYAGGCAPLGSEPLELFRLADGVNCESEAVRSSAVLGSIAEQVARHPLLSHLFRGPPPSLQQALELPEAEALVLAFDAFVQRFFYMSSSDEDVSAVRFRQDPSAPWRILLGHISRALQQAEENGENEGNEGDEGELDFDAGLRRIAAEQHGFAGRFPRVETRDTAAFASELWRGSDLLRGEPEKEGQWLQTVYCLREFLGWKEAIHVWYTYHQYFLRLVLVELASRLRLFSGDELGFPVPQAVPAGAKARALPAGAVPQAVPAEEQVGAEHPLWSLDARTWLALLRGWREELPGDAQPGAQLGAQLRAKVGARLRAAVQRSLALGRMFARFAAPAEIAGGQKRIHVPEPQEAGGEFLDPAGALLEGTSVRGQACAAGLVQGRVCVLGGLHEADLLRPGDVLVAELTNPSWSPLFALASAVVLEHGGMLSHAALVAREHGIPLVTQVLSARRLFRTGDTVSVDGKTGTVTVLKRC